MLLPPNAAHQLHPPPHAGITAVQLVVIFIVIILGFTKADTANVTPFLPMGWRGITDAAGFVFFRCAMETLNP